MKTKCGKPVVRQCSTVYVVVHKIVLVFVRSLLSEQGSENESTKVTTFWTRQWKWKYKSDKFSKKLLLKVQKTVMCSK